MMKRGQIHILTAANQVVSMVDRLSRLFMVHLNLARINKTQVLMLSNSKKMDNLTLLIIQWAMEISQRF